jgi:hypothetical protein
MACWHTLWRSNGARCVADRTWRAAVECNEPDPEPGGVDAGYRIEHRTSFCVSHDVGLRLSSVSNHEVMPAKVSEEVALADPSASFVLPIKGFAVSARDFKTAVVPIMTPLDEALPCRQRWMRYKNRRDAMMNKENASSCSSECRGEQEHVKQKIDP